MVNIIVLIFIFLIISIICIFKIFNEKAVPQFISYSEVRIKRIVSSIISSTIIEEVANSTDINNLFITDKESNGDIKSIDFNSSIMNKILVNTSRLVEQNLRYLENGDIYKLKLYNISDYDEDNFKEGVIYELPSGIIFNNVFLNNLLPKIPVKLSLIGNIFCNLNTDIEPYGINSALIKVNVWIQVEVKILMPFVSSSTKVESDIPIVMKIIEGNIPSYYFSDYLNSPSLTTSINN